MDLHATARCDHQTSGEDISARSHERIGDGGAGLVFWCLIALAMTGFAPAMILPAWYDFAVSACRERQHAAEVAAAHAQVERLEARLDAIRNDPGVVARLARRELSYHAAGEETVPVLVGESAAHETPAANPVVGVDLVPVQPPVAIARLLPYLPRLNYQRVFCESPSRETILALSGGLFVAAFVIFWPRRRTEEIFQSSDG